jgi:hypothetical protein
MIKLGSVVKRYGRDPVRAFVPVGGLVIGLAFVIFGVVQVQAMRDARRDPARRHCSLAVRAVAVAEIRSR